MIKAALYVEPVPLSFIDYMEFTDKWHRTSEYLEYRDGMLFSRGIPEETSEGEGLSSEFLAVWEGINAAICGIRQTYRDIVVDGVEVLDGTTAVYTPHLAFWRGKNEYTFVDFATPNEDVETCLKRIRRCVELKTNSVGYVVALPEVNGKFGSGEPPVIYCVQRVKNEETGTAELTTRIELLIRPNADSVALCVDDIKSWFSIGCDYQMFGWVRSYGTEHPDHYKMESELAKFRVIRNTRLQRMSRELKACIQAELDDNDASLADIPLAFGKAMLDVVESVDRVVSTKAFRTGSAVSGFVENHVLPTVIDKVKPLQKLCNKISKLDLD